MSFFRSIMMFLALAALPVAAAAQAAPAAQPFLDTPKLQRVARPGPLKLTESLKVNPTTCNPAGDINQIGNVVSVNLVARMDANSIHNPSTGAMDQVRLRSYGGCLTGPQLDLTPGSTLRIHLQNDLPKDDPTCPDGNDPPDGSAGCLNTLNMHFHGLHVSPSGNSDNVLLNIAPGTTFDYEVNIPGDHPAGTFWYHAHRHGSTATQVASGESGALIIHGNRYPTGDGPNETPGDIDTILHGPDKQPFRERVMLFQQIAYGCFKSHTKDGHTFYTYEANDLQQNIPKGAQQGPWYCNAGQEGVIENFNAQLSSPTVWDTSGRFTSINGAVQPTITGVKAGAIERWRMIHGGIHDTVNVQIVPMKISSNAKALLAAQGIFQGSPQEQASLIAELCPITSNPEDPRSAPLQLPQFEIATDGLTRDMIRPIGAEQKATSGGIGTNFMQPGYRSDVLVVFPKAGTYCVLNQAALESERAKNGSGPGGQGPNKVELLATVQVSGGTPITETPQAYLYRVLYEGNKDDAKLTPQARVGLRTGILFPWRGMQDLMGVKPNPDVQKVNFFIGNLPYPQNFPPNSPPFSQNTQPLGPWSAFGFYINKRIYDPERIDFIRPVGTTDDWELTADVEPHIFHIHVNPFEVTDVLYRGKSIFDSKGNCTFPPDSLGLQNQYCGMWHTFKDTVFVQPDYIVKIRTQYVRYIGEFVIHCHILDHEDGGMMTNVQIVPNLGAPGNGLGMPGMHHGAGGSHATQSINNPSLLVHDDSNDSTHSMHH